MLLSYVRHNLQEICVVKEGGVTEPYQLNLMQISHKVGRAGGRNDFSNTL